MYIHQNVFFQSGQTKGLEFRLSQLEILRRAIGAYEKQISEALRADLDKSAAESYATEIGFCLHEISGLIRNLRKWARPARVKNSSLFPLSRSLVHPEPYGEVLIISPWNYPFGLAVSPLAAALAAGNCVTLKPSEFSVNTSAVLQKMAKQYFNPEFVQVILGDWTAARDLLARRFDYIFFTGSSKVGKIVMQAAAQNLTPLTLELGGKSPCVVDDTCNIQRAAERLVYGKFLNAGQTCIAPDYVLVQENIKTALISTLKKNINKFFGDNIITSPDYGRIINASHFKRLSGFLPFGDIVVGGRTDEKALFIEPTILENVPPQSPVMQEEIFGPILPVLAYKHLPEAIDFINARPKPLALYLFSASRSRQREVLSKTSAGGVCINDTIIHITNPQLPFGGVGDSGFGQYHGRAGFTTFSHLKSVLRNTNLFNIPGRLPPYNKGTVKLLKRFLG